VTFIYEYLRKFSKKFKVALMEYLGAWEDTVAFLWNFFISKEAATAERRYEKERHSVKLHACKLHLVQGQICSLFSLPSLSPLHTRLSRLHYILQATSLRRPEVGHNSTRRTVSSLLFFPLKLLLHRVYIFNIFMWAEVIDSRRL
jgi:hypothetical protein